LLGSITCYTYRNFRSVYLSPPGNQIVVRDEARRKSFGQQDTDLSEYIPFAENNKLVKIESPMLTIDAEHPIINGSTALYPIYAAAVQALYKNVDKGRFTEYEITYGKSYANSSTSPKAFESLLEGSSDLLIMAMPSDKQLQVAKDKNIELVITPLGYEAFVFFASTVNPVEELTLEQIRRIYSKRTTNWNEVGGNDERILPFQRPEGSGSQTAMLRLMGDVPLAPPLQEEFRRGMGSIVTDVADYRNYGNALGFSFRYYVEGLFKHEGVKLLKVEGVAPTIENIQKGTYPLTGEFVFITRKDNANPNVAKLRDWFLSTQGQELIEKVGYVPIKQ
jgi:phosphate transport system substrate-binding protein